MAAAPQVITTTLALRGRTSDLVTPSPVAVCPAIGMCSEALVGASKESVLSAQPLEPLSAKVGALAEGKYRHKSRDAVRGTGYCVESLEAALWCFAQSSSFKEAVLLAANLGDDADTTAAICGQLSGAFYGVQGIPQEWRDKLVMFAEMNEMAHQLLALSERR